MKILNFWLILSAPYGTNYKERCKKYNEYRHHYALNGLIYVMYINNNHETHTINNLSQLFATPEIVLDFSSESVRYHAAGWSEINANQSMYGLYEMLSKRKGNKAKNLIDDKEKRAKVLKDVTEIHKEAKDIIARLDVNVDVTLTDDERAFLGGLQSRTHEIFKYINEAAKKEEKSNLYSDQCFDIKKRWKSSFVAYRRPAMKRW